MRRGTILNWWLFGTAVMLAVNPLNRIVHADFVQQHPGTVGGAMIAGADAPYGLLLAATVALYSIVIRSSKPIVGIVLAGMLYLLVQLACVMILDLLIETVWHDRLDWDILSFALPVLFLPVAFFNLNSKTKQETNKVANKFQERTSQERRRSE